MFDQTVFTAFCAKDGQRLLPGTNVLPDWQSGTEKRDDGGWGETGSAVREAINALSSGVERLQRPADAWLQQFSAAPGSWRLCLKLLEAPDVQSNECFFAANNIRTACMKHQDVLEVITLSELLPQLAYHLQACLHRQLWPPANQLAAAIAALAARSPSMHPDALPQVICNGLSPAVAQALADASAATATAANAAAAAAAAQQQQQQSPHAQQPQGQWGYSGWHSNLGAQADPSAAASMAAAAAAGSARSQEHLQLRLQQEPLVLAALLQVLAALPDTLQSRQVLWYSFDRREAVKASLMASNSTTLVVAAALCSQNSRLLVLSCDVLGALCELGAAPLGLEVQSGALQVLAGAVLSSTTSTKAADALAALAKVCKGSTSTSTASRAHWQLLQQIVQQLQYAVFPALTVQQQRSMAGQGRLSSSSSSSTPAAQPLGLLGVTAAGGVSYIQVVCSRFGASAEAAFCRMLCAVASALLVPFLQGSDVQAGMMEQLLQQLLLCIASEDDGTAMFAVNFWQEEYAAQLQALPQQQQAAALVQQQQVIQGLTGALVRRTQLTPTALITATADARDLPEEMRLIRRELAAGLRDVGTLVGRQAMLSFMVQLVRAHHQALLASTGPAGGAAGAGPAGLNAAAAVACCQLEGALYAANVILGRLGDTSSPEVDQLVQQLVVYAAAAASAHADIHKLAGTALTLLGGLSTWLVGNPSHLPDVMNAVIIALRSSDDKLARNAATCVQRLTSCEQLAALLFASQPACVQQLLTEYQRRGGLPMTLVPSIGDDQSTEELLLLSLCSIAVAHSSSSNSVADINNILAQLVGPQLAEASQELQAALQDNWPQQLPSVLEAPLPPQAQQRQQHRPRRGSQQPRQQPQPQSSKAAVCFDAVAKLVTGLPTGVSRHTIGVPMHTRHPRHQRMVEQVQALQGLPAPSRSTGLQQQQQQQQASGGGAPLSGVAAAAVPASVSMSGAASDTSSESGSATAADTATPAGRLMASLHVGQGRQLPHHALQRQQHACLFVSQLLVQAQQAVMLALQTVTLAAAQEETVRFASQLMSAVSSFLQAALPAALHYHLLTHNTSQAESAVPGGPSSAPTGGGAPSRTATAAPSVLQPSLLLLQLCQLLERMPGQVLQQTASLQLLVTIVTCASLAGALPEDECLDLDVLRQQPAPPQQQPDRQQQQLLMLLQRLIGTGLTNACQTIIQQQGAVDEDFAAAALALASVSLQQCPAVLVSVDMGLLLNMTLVSTRTYHLKQVTALLDWIQIAVYGAYAQVQPAWDASGSSTVMPVAVLPATPAAAPADTTGVGFSRNLLAALRVRFEAGVGAQLVLALMIAASGAMPSDVVLPVSLCLHAMWLTVGPQLFQAWLQAAVLQAAPEAAPWARARQILKVQFLQNLTERSCLTDTTKFKGILKSFCGGKKKGPGRY